MNKEEIIMEGFGLKKELTIQLISLSTAILVLSISFLERLTRDIYSKRTFMYLKISWVGYFISIIFGIWTLMSITGNLLHGNLKNGWNIKSPQMVQIVTFGISTVCMIKYGTMALSNILKKTLTSR